MRFFVMLRKYYVIAVILIVILFLPSLYIYRSLKDYLIDKYKKETKAVIVDERNYLGNSPVSHEYSYSYSFDVEGNLYNGNPHNSSLKIGDSIKIEYCNLFPKFNRVKK